MRPDLQKRLAAVVAVLEGTANIAEKSLLQEKSELRTQILDLAKQINSGDLAPNAKSDAVSRMDQLGQRLMDLGSKRFR